MTLNLVILSLVASTPLSAAEKNDNCLNLIEGASKPVDQLGKHHQPIDRLPQERITLGARPLDMVKALRQSESGPNPSADGDRQQILAEGFDTSLRPPQTLDPVVLFRMTEAVPRIDGLRISNSLIAATEFAFPAGRSVSRYGSLNGRPVAVKTFIHSDVDLSAIENEARGAIILSTLGIGPTFYGVAEVDGQHHLVTNIIAGENFAPPRPKTLKNLENLETAIHRLRAINILFLPKGRVFPEGLSTAADDSILLSSTYKIYELFLDANKGWITHDVLGSQSKFNWPEPQIDPWSYNLYEVLADSIMGASDEVAGQYLNSLAERSLKSETSRECYLATVNRLKRILDYRDQQKNRTPGNGGSWRAEGNYLHALWSAYFTRIGHVEADLRPVIPGSTTGRTPVSVQLRLLQPTPQIIVIHPESKTVH